MLVLYSAVAGFVYSNSVFFVVWDLECGRQRAAHDFDANPSGYYISFRNEEMRKTRSASIPRAFTYAYSYLDNVYISFTFLT